LAAAAAAKPAGLRGRAGGEDNSFGIASVATPRQTAMSAKTEKAFLSVSGPAPSAAAAVITWLIRVSAVAPLRAVLLKGYVGRGHIGASQNQQPSAETSPTASGTTEQITECTVAALGERIDNVETVDRDCRLN
jgi:hypothetical protein